MFDTDIFVPLPMLWILFTVLKFEDDVLMGFPPASLDAVQLHTAVFSSVWQLVLLESNMIP